MAKGNGEKISTGSLPLLSQGWDEFDNSGSLLCFIVWVCGFVGVKNVRGPAWGRTSVGESKGH
ncbi:hypothetical protein FH972_002173 [Carpinus fangiana]|uniref:Uncharacterized protein n=1 Tax=Carpinus fangiana TaxID=176857 RepID=A0A5N6QEE4_9ROSI|nr:hypothetical protein FH972_002173 [Carpinus fangiana]